MNNRTKIDAWAWNIANCSFTSSKIDEKLRLPDGRLLSYAEFGTDGPAIMYLVGLPECRLSGYLIEDAAIKHNLRIIVPERPGFGLSTEQPGRSIRDHVGDIRHLADHLELPRFAVLGHSAGGAYALACARFIPERLTSVGLFCSTVPSLVQESSIGLRATCWLALHAPLVLQLMLTIVVGTVRLLSSTFTFGMLCDAWLKPRTISKMPLAQRRNSLVNMFITPYAQGAGATVDEFALMCRPWGFNLEEITSPITMWHGRQDVNVRIGGARRMATVLKATLKEYNATHYTIDGHIDEVLEEMKEQISKRAA